MDPLVLKISMPNRVQMIAVCAKPVIAAAIEAAWMQRFDDRFRLIMNSLRVEAKQDKYTADGQFGAVVKQRFKGTFEFNKSQLDEISGALMSGRQVSVQHVYTYPAAQTAVDLVGNFFR